MIWFLDDCQQMIAEQISIEEWCHLVLKPKESRIRFPMFRFDITNFRFIYVYYLAFKG